MNSVWDNWIDKANPPARATGEAKLAAPRVQGGNHRRCRRLIAASPAGAFAGSGLDVVLEQILPGVTGRWPCRVAHHHHAVTSSRAARICTQALAASLPLTEVLEEEAVMVRAVVVIVRRQHRRKHRHAGRQLHVHHAVEDGAGDEIMPVDAAIDDQGAAEDRGIAAGLGEGLGMQRDLIGARARRRCRQ